MPEFIHGEETRALLGACFEVYREKGCGFLEAVFLLRQTYQPDFLCLGKVILEIKAVTKLGDEHRAQVHNYLRATGLRVGLLVNFGHYPLVEHERIVR